MVLEAETINGWMQHKIKDFGVVTTGTTPSTKNQSYYGGEYKLISPADLTDSKYIFTAHKFITAEGLKFARTIPKNAVLVGCIGNVGKIGMTTDEISAFNQQINAIVCNDNFNADFVYYLLRYQRPLLESKAMKVTLPILNKNNFENIEFEVPTLPEQKSIARVLTTVQEAITGQEELITKLKELKRGMMQYLFTHGTKGEKTKMTEIGEVPESWDIVSLSSVVNIVMGQSPSSKTYNSNATGLPFYQGKTDFGQKYPTPRIYCNDPKKTAKHGDILMSVRAPVGPVNIAISDCCIGRGLGAIRAENKLDQNFLYFYLIFSEKKIASLGTGSTFHAINKNQLSDFKIFLPNIDEQNVISNIFLSLDQKIEATQEKLSTYQNLFKTLLHELMSGERRVRF